MVIEKFKDIKIAFLRRSGKYGPENKQLMERLKQIIIKYHLLKNDVTILGIALGNPFTTPDSE